MSESSEGQGTSDEVKIVVQDHSRESQPNEECALPARKPKVCGRGRKRRKGRPSTKVTPLRRITVDKITDEIYEAFVALTISNDSSGKYPKDTMEAIELMQSCGDYTVETNVHDELMGPLAAVILHVPTKRYILTASQREKAIDSAVKQFKAEKHVVGSCLRAMQNYIGFPPVIQLRDRILETLDREEKSVGDVATSKNKIEMEAAEGPQPVIESPPPAPELDVTSEPGEPDIGELLLEMPSGEIIRVEAVHDDGSISAYVGGELCRLYNNDLDEAYARGLLPVIARQCSSSAHQQSLGAISDSIYDELAQVLVGRITFDEIPTWNSREAVKSLVNEGLYYAEFWEEGDGILPSGWKILTRQSQKIVPKRSQCQMICKKWLERLGTTQATSDILRMINDKYVGVVNQTKIKEASRLNLLKGARVQFPFPIHVYGSKPMQYVQVDIIDMDVHTLGDREYRQVLLITDLFSQFIFGRALAESTDNSMIARYLVDIFCGYGPPEGFRSSCVLGVVSSLMTEISRMFKVSIKNFGLGHVEHHSLKKGMYKRAEDELQNRQRWVEVMPFAIIEYNQKPHRVFEMQISPFEIMFGRRPWKDIPLPPWVRIGGNSVSAPIEGDLNGNLSRRVAVEEEPSTNDAATPQYLKQTTSLHRRIEQISASSAVVHHYDNSLRDPGTGILYEIGDRVYMRNPVYKEASRPSLVRNRAVVARYFRAVITEIDYAHPDFFYRVNYWPDLTQVQTDHLGNDDWPGEDAHISWVSPSDLSPSSVELNRKRSLFRHKEEQWKCRCGAQLCGLTFSEKCPYRMSLRCCTKLNPSCPYHRKVAQSSPSKQPTASKRRRVFGFGPLEKTSAKKPVALYRDMQTIRPEDCSWPGCQ